MSTMTLLKSMPTGRMSVHHTYGKRRTHTLMTYIKAGSFGFFFSGFNLHGEVSSKRKTAIDFGDGGTLSSLGGFKRGGIMLLVNCLFVYIP